jgi:DNA-directed RNA polymerase subunit L
MNRYITQLPMTKYLLLIVPVAGIIFLDSSCQKKGRNNNATDTLTYEIKTLTTTYENCITDSPDCTYITYSYPHFSITDTAGEKLNTYVRYLLGETGKTTLQQTQTTFINDYKLYLKDSKMKQPWYRQTNIDIAYQHNKIVSLKIDMDDYTGGAHGMYSITYYVFDKAKRKALPLSSLLKKDKMSEVTTLAEKAFRKGVELSDNTDLDKAGFWFKDNKFALNDNYCIISEGIVWLYNPYEIAPYASGTTEVTLTKEELMPYLNEAYTDVWN